MPKTLIKVDINKSAEKQDMLPHNRWHPDIPFVASVKPGEDFRIECLDWTGGQIVDDKDATDMRDVDLTKVHYLSGPVEIAGAEPGDLLVVDILDIGAFQESEWGFTGIFARENGGGFLVDHYPEARKACWDFHGIYATSRHVPGVRIHGMSHPGLIGCLPSRELLNEWNAREAELIATDPNRIPPLAAPPYADTALLGHMPPQQAKEAAKVGARTVPPREHGGNVDIKNLTRGSRIYFPVYVEGGGLSVGDLHFSQGDGEITFCGAIEMAGWIDLHVDLIKGGMEKYGIKNPIFKTGTSGPNYNDFLVFEGISVDERGKQHYLDAHVAYKQAALNAIEYLKKFGYSGEQAYVILGTAPVEGRISGIVDIPNACATLYIPTEIFEFNIMPDSAGPRVLVDRAVELAKPT